MGVRKKVTNKELCMQDHTLSHILLKRCPSMYAKQTIRKSKQGYHLHVCFKLYNRLRCHLVVGWILRMQTATHADLQMHLLIYNSWFSILHTSKTENLWHQLQVLIILVSCFHLQFTTSEFHDKFSCYDFSFILSSIRSQLLCK
jgi:hypothetical protein